ncbi:putative agamous-like MADS-box protein AGL62-like [Capsicum annuum]|uniref:Uncharacterized protein n=1 Tax=Capsicum annuum TaxID=4072 RepID=A0A2G3AE93_CAPAN|nr:putative agamous-like MADS-box protein AGL62-like [Capsicum annuum]KAF3670341.1 putative agamous-like MADS-box protein AGL62-like [Capsicum annuum]PHT92559.1 hypothetical protein T459_00441 [Capsicum annuum]
MKIKGDKIITLKFNSKISPARLVCSPSVQQKPVGFQDELEKIIHSLRHGPRELDIISIAGMAVRAWTTVSYEYREKDMLLDLFYQVVPRINEINQESYKQPVYQEEIYQENIADRLQKSLKRKRFLIVVDDMWSTAAWDNMSRLFPDDDNGSRVILTSRLIDVVTHANPDRQPHRLNFQNNDEGWELLCQKLFGKRVCPPELEEIGRSIAEKCQGLPLAIVVVAGHLSKMSKTPDCWNTVAETCFLYMGAYPEDFEIPLSKLIRLWIAEGFLNATALMTVEKIADECLKDLIGRSLVLAEKWSNGKLKTCKLHDIMRNFCLEEAKRQLSTCLEALPQCSIRKRNNSSASNFKLLRVLDITFQHFPRFPNEIMQLVNLRYLALATGSEFFPPVSQFWSLQTLILHVYSSDSTLPRDIWKMPNLRYLHVKPSICLPSPTKHNNSSVLSNLQTLANITLSDCTKDVEIGNLESVSALWSDCIRNLALLPQLEALKIVGLKPPVQVPKLSLHLDALPENLKKLTLSFTYLPWESMSSLCRLPNLEVLKLKNYAFTGPKWEHIEEGFVSLKLLLIEVSDLEEWSASNDHFPCLEHLVLKSCLRLNSIPHDLGDIPTLQIIEVENSSQSAAFSAKEIQEEQQSFGNDTLEVRIERNFWRVNVVATP